MTAEEKAKELVDEFYGIVDDNAYTSMDWGKETAKKCALIFADEMLKYNRFGVPKNDYLIIPYEEQPQWEDYWQEVKTQIEKL